MSRWVSVFCIDPGVISGWCWLCFERKLLSSDGELGAIRVGKEVSFGWFHQGQVNCSFEQFGVSKLLRFIGLSLALAEKHIGVGEVESVVVMEDFVLREMTMDRVLLAPVRVSSKVEMGLFLSEDLQETSVIYQSASDAKSVVTDDRLVKWGLAKKGHVVCDCHRHSNDAVRHLVIYLRSLLGH